MLSPGDLSGARTMLIRSRWPGQGKGMGQPHGPWGLAGPGMEDLEWLTAPCCVHDTVQLVA